MSVLSHNSCFMDVLVSEVEKGAFQPINYFRPFTNSHFWPTYTFFQGQLASHLYVACWSVCNHNQNVWLAKSVLDHLTFKGQRWNCTPGSRGHLDSILIPLTNASTRDIKVTTPCLWSVCHLCLEQTLETCFHVHGTLCWKLPLCLSYFFFFFLLLQNLSPVYPSPLCCLGKLIFKSLRWWNPPFHKCSKTGWF